MVMPAESARQRSRSPCGRLSAPRGTQSSSAAPRDRPSAVPRGAQQRAKVGGSSSCSAARRYLRRRCACSRVSCAAPEARGEVSHGLPAGWGTVMEVMGIPIQSCASSAAAAGSRRCRSHGAQTHYVVSIPGTKLVLSTLISGTRIPFSTSNHRIIR